MQLKVTINQLKEIKKHLLSEEISSLVKKNIIGGPVGKINKVQQGIIPIGEDIINESPDSVKNSDDYLLAHWSNDDAIAFGFSYGKVYIGYNNELFFESNKIPQELKDQMDKEKFQYVERMMIHTGISDFYDYLYGEGYSDHISGNRNDFKFPGRIWFEKKIISFWQYPDKSQLNKLLELIKKEINSIYGIIIDFSKYRIEIKSNNYEADLDDDDEDYMPDVSWQNSWRIGNIIPIKDFISSQDATDDEMKNIHSLPSDEKRKTPQMQAARDAESERLADKFNGNVSQAEWNNAKKKYQGESKKIKITTNQLNEIKKHLNEMNINDIYKKYYSNINYDDFRWIVSSDELTSSLKNNKLGEYAKWLLNTYLKGNLKLEDLYKAKEYIPVFDRVKKSNRIENPDLNSYKSLSDMYLAIEKYLTKSEYSGRDNLSENEYDKVYEDDEWVVLVPKTKNAACVLGSDTQWCTSKPEYNSFDEYNKKGKLYININKKTGKKYQFHFESGQFKNIYDNEISINEMELNDGLIQFYNKIDSEFKFKSKYDWVGENINNLRIVQLKDKYGLINNDGVNVTPIIYDWIGNFKDGVYEAELDGKIISLNKFNEDKKTIKLTKKQLNEIKKHLKENKLYHASNTPINNITSYSDYKKEKSGYYEGMFFYDDLSQYQNYFNQQKYTKDKYYFYEIPVENLNLYELTDSDKLKDEARKGGFPANNGSGYYESRYLDSIGYDGIKNRTEIILFHPENFKFNLISSPGLQEDINLDVEVGDTIKMGKFKNKKTLVKKIDKDTHGMPTINGKQAATFRTIKEAKDYVYGNFNGETIETTNEDSDAIPFVYYNNKVFVGYNPILGENYADDGYKDDNGENNYPNFHADITDFYKFIHRKDPNYKVELPTRRNDYDYLGRIWYDREVISFYKYPENKNKMKEIISLLNKELNNVYGETFNFDYFIVDTTNDGLVSMKDYIGSENTPDNIIDSPHLLSPNQKKDSPQLNAVKNYNNEKLNNKFNGDVSQAEWNAAKNKYRGEGVEINGNPLLEDFDPTNIKFKFSKTEDNYSIRAFENDTLIGSIESEDISQDYYEYEFEDVWTEDELEEIFPEYNICKINYLTVNPEYQKSGVAKKLLTMLLDKKRKDNFKQFYLNASPMGFNGLNVNSLVEFYKKFGFKILLNQGNNVLMGISDGNVINESIDNENNYLTNTKIVDDNGNALKVYRAQKDERTQGVGRSSNHKGIYFSADKNSVKIYGDKVKEYFLNIKNPIVLKNLEWNLSVISEHIYNDLINKGYDGAIWVRNGVMYEIVAFYENQVIPINNNINEATIDDVNLSSFKPKKELNDKIWSNETMILKPNVRRRLLKITDDFFEYINVDIKHCKDVLLIGSLANYNWSKYSDIDLHFLVDFKKINADYDLVKDYFDAKKKTWLEEHDDLKIYNFPVEVYVQDMNEKNASVGVYSIEKNKWINKPSEIEEHSENNKLKIKLKASELMTEIDDLLDAYKNNPSFTKLEKISKKSKKLYNKIKRIRKYGLETKSGEQSINNIVFKVLRRSGHLAKLIDLKASTYDKMNSIK